MPSSHLASRRQWLRRSAAGVGAYFLPRPASAESLLRSGAPAKQVIYIYLQGGLSHFESFDPKPDAPVELRGEFGTIPTTIPGIRFSEHVPLLAKKLNRFSVVRSACHPTPDHLNAIHITLTGWPILNPNIDSRNHNDKPAVGAMAAKFLGADRPDVPGYVCIPHRDQLGHRLHYGSAAYLGAAYEPLDSGMLPERSDLPYAAPAGLRLASGLSANRLQQRLDLLGQFDRPGVVKQETASAYNRQAFELLANDIAGKAFDLNAEPTSVRQRYGDHGMGQQALLARRLAQAGVPFTLVNFSLNQVKGQDWDTHVDNFKLMKNELLPPMERAVTTLLDDLAERGMLDSTLVLMSGEFGRTPRINAQSGRDHWPNVFSVMMAGGGVKPGIVLGSSTRGGEEPKDRPVPFADVLATLYHQLGVPTDAVFRDALSRPFPVLNEGKPIPELI